MRLRIVSGAMALVGAWALSACAVIPDAVVAVPKNAKALEKPLTEKPLFQIDRLEAVQGDRITWGFANDQAKETVLRFNFGQVSPFENEYGFACLTLDEQTLRRRVRKTTVRATRDAAPAPAAPAAGAPAAGAPATDQSAPLPTGTSFTLPAATKVGPSVCLATLKVRRNAAARDYAYTIYQDGVLKQDPVIVIRTR